MLRPPATSEAASHWVGLHLRLSCPCDKWHAAYVIALQYLPVSSCFPACVYNACRIVLFSRHPQLCLLDESRWTNRSCISTAVWAKVTPPMLYLRWPSYPYILYHRTPI